MRSKCLVLSAVVMTAAVMAGCESQEAASRPAPALQASSSPAAPASTPTTTAPAAAPVAAAPAAPVAPANFPPVKDLPGIENYRRLSSKIAQGGQPNGEASFRALQAEGITTVVTVDGAVPDLENAKKFGLTYVHIPIGYDGLSTDEQARVVKAVKEANGPVYIHCHHGLHRGPAAAMIARQGIDGLTSEQAVAELKASGCSPNYEGLYRDVKEWRAPSAETLAALGKLPEVIKPTGVRESMVHVDEHYDYLKASQKAKWKVSPEYPDISPPHEAGMMAEALRELGRLPEAQKLGADFVALAKASEEAAVALKAALDAGALDRAEKAWGPFKQSCENCHKTYRN